MHAILIDVPFAGGQGRAPGPCAPGLALSLPGPPASRRLPAPTGNAFRPFDASGVVSAHGRVRRPSARRKPVEKVRQGAENGLFRVVFRPKTCRKLSKTVENFAADRSANHVRRRSHHLDRAGFYPVDGSRGDRR